MTSSIPKKTARTTASRAAAPKFSAEERAAMRERAREQDAADGESAVTEKIAGMSDADRALAERLHALITASAPSLTPRLWYGMPAYAKGGKVLCFFQSAQKFKTRYATLGFSDVAQLDDGNLWPTAYALKELTPDAEARIRALLQQAVG